MSSSGRSQSSNQALHGLLNRHSTCYLNSVLQVLFMTRDFRDAVQRNSNGKNIEYHLNTLFRHLKTQTANTDEIIKELGIVKGRQGDAAEHFEKILARTSDNTSQIFRGEMTYKIICSKCKNSSDTTGPFWHLPVALKKFDGITGFFKESYISGENKLYCDYCNDKTDATLKCELKDPPEVLTLLLKRFEFDYYKMRYIKNNCDVDVPCSLHIPESHMYELYAVVDHTGDLRSGHYMARIKSQDDERWYMFNDTTVRLCDHEPFQADKHNTSSSAYLLFYRKEKTPAAVSGGFLPAVGNNDDHCQDVGKKRKTEDDEEPLKGSKERREDRGDVDDQEQQIDERKIMNADGEVGDTAVDNRRAFTETQPEESREDQDREDSVRLDKPHEGLEAKHNASYNEERGKQEVGIMQPEQGFPHQVNVNMQGCEERKIMCVDTDKTGESDGDEQTDKVRETLTKHPNRDEKDEFNGRLDIVKPYVSVDKKRGEEEIEISNRDDNGGKTRPSGREELSTRSDHYCQKVDNHGDHSASKDAQGCKQRSSSSKSYKRHGPPKEERKDDEGQMERKAGNDQPAQERSKSESGRGQSDQRNGADVRSDRSEQNVSVGAWLHRFCCFLFCRIRPTESQGDVSMHGRQQVNVNMQRDEERKVTHVDTDKTGESEGDEQKETERETLIKHPHRAEKDEFNGRLDIVKHIKDDEGGKQEVREEYGSSYVSVGKKRGEEEIEVNNRDDKGGKTRTSGREELSTRSDHYCLITMETTVHQKMVRDVNREAVVEAAGHTKDMNHRNRRGRMMRDKWNKREDTINPK